MKSENRKIERIAIKKARDNNDPLPHGGRVRRSNNVMGELSYRNIDSRYYNRRDRRLANIQLLEAIYFPEIDITGKPFINMISATSRITS